MSVIVSEVHQLNNTRNNRTKRGNQIHENDELQRVNFWDLVLDPSIPSLSEYAKRELDPALDIYEKQRIIDAIHLFKEKNGETALFN
jgi:hypothetical protein